MTRKVLYHTTNMRLLATEQVAIAHSK